MAQDYHEPRKEEGGNSGQAGNDAQIELNLAEKTPKFISRDLICSSYESKKQLASQRKLTKTPQESSGASLEGLKNNHS